MNPEYSLEGLMLKSMLQYFGHLMQGADWLENTLMLGKTDGRRRGNRGQDGWMASLTQCTWVWASSGSWWCTEKPGVLQSMGLQRVWHNWATATELNWVWVMEWPFLQFTQKGNKINMRHCRAVIFGQDSDYINVGTLLQYSRLENPMDGGAW